MLADPSVDRITQLEGAFQSLARSVPGLDVEVVGHVVQDESRVHPVAGFEVKLQHDEDGAGVALYVSASYAELTRWSPHAGPLGGSVRERFNVRLSEGWIWGDSEFDSPDQLASELLGYMQFNLDALSVA